MGYIENLKTAVDALKRSRETGVLILQSFNAGNDIYGNPRIVEALSYSVPDGRTQTKHIYSFVGYEHGNLRIKLRQLNIPFLDQGQVMVKRVKDLPTKKWVSTEDMVKFALDNINNQ